MIESRPVQNSQNDDPELRLPPSVRRQIEHGQAVHDALMRGDDPPPSDGVPTVRVKGTAVEAMAPSPEGQQSPTVPEGDAANTAAAASPAPSDDNASEDDRYTRLSAMFRTLQGKYNSETARLNGQLRELQTKLDAAATKIIELTTSSETPPKNNPLTGGADYGKVTDEEVEEFGPKLIGLVERRAQEIAAGLVSAKVAELQTKLDKLGSSVEGLDEARHLTEADRRNAYLDQHMPGWREIDNDPLFLEWLDDEDAFTGFSRRDVLARAMRLNDYARIVLIFEGYSKEQQALSAHTRPNGKAPKVRADTLAAPSSGRATPRQPTAPATPETFTSQQVRDFYNKRATNRTGMTEVEIADMEKRIHEAAQSNRIVSNRRV